MSRSDRATVTGRYFGRYEFTHNASRLPDASVSFPTDDAGEHVIRIPNVNALHRAIALGIVTRKIMMDGRETRFLRTEMGMTQAELATMIHRARLTISRWERSETEFDANAETLIRLHAIERLKLEVEDGISEISGWSVPRAVQQPILIDGSDPSNIISPHNNRCRPRRGTPDAGKPRGRAATMSLCESCTSYFYA